MKHPIIDIQHLSIEIDGESVLRDVNLTIFGHDFLGIIGPNGGGKTTLVKAILGLIKPINGSICYYNNEGTSVSSIRIGYLPQYNNLDKQFPISVADVILSGLKPQGHLIKRYTQEQRRQAHVIAKQMGMEGMESRHIGSLSGGELQRVLLGRALISNPDVVILDEPNTYLDRKFETKLYDLLEEINQERAIILVSHDIGTVLQNVKSIACLNKILDYHPDTEISAEWLEKNFGCPIELLGHGDLPHRVLRNHRQPLIMN
ncbi:MAG: ABC transporter ATP-binding protein [Bacteroidales bacterium]|nr:ABC transporter ATP-binding protein [Bacteroidales bacterium]